MADAQPPVQPRTDPGFRDMRPAAQIIQNPIEGHDYSYHPQAPEIQAGLTMKRMNAGMPAAGIRIGMPGQQAPARPPAASVGVANAYAPKSGLPDPSREYTPEEANQLTVPKGWGSGEITIGGQTTHLFSSPEQIAAARAKQQVVASQAAHDREARSRAQMIQGIDSNMHALMNEYYGGRASLDEVANATAALSQFAGAHLANDAAHAEAGAVRSQHFDPRQNPEYMAASINQMNAQAENDRAEALNKDPMKKIDLLRAITGDPHLRSVALAMQGVDPATINALPPTPGPGGIHAGNVAQALATTHRGLGDILNDADLSFDDKLARASQSPDFADRHSAHRQAFDAWLRQQYGNRPGDWQRMWYSPPQPSGYPAHDFLATLGARLINAPARLIGVGNSGGIGANPFSAQSDYNAAQQRIGILNRYGISPY